MLVIVMFGELDRTGSSSPQQRKSHFIRTPPSVDMQIRSMALLYSYRRYLLVRLHGNTTEESPQAAVGLRGESVALPVETILTVDYFHAFCALYCAQRRHG
jgi:hypothetical protein